VGQGRSPRDELDLIERLVRRSGADSEALFGAYNLGEAYHSAGRYSSKRAKIAAALQAARSQNRLDDVLDAMADLVEEHSTRERSRATEGRDVELIGQKLFISHASVDAPLAGSLQRALILGGMPTDRIFYSSARPTGIPAGQDVGPYLRQSLREAGLVVELLTPAFLTRPICLMELGGAWVSETPTFPVVIPPLTIQEASDAIGNVHLRQLTMNGPNQGIFSELYDRIARDLKLNLSAHQWAEAINEFDAGLATKITALSHSDGKLTSEPSVQEPRTAQAGIKEEFTFSRVVIRGSRLFGEATNNDSIEHTAILAVTFYDADGAILGSDTAVVNGVRPGQSRTFSIENVVPHSSRKIEVSTLI